ncbi:MAG: hypothetical protein KGJ21_08925, partial [Pseudomonadota bacterium]|nr:hypothetical protein [Pseudomonadota bacterium]
MLRFAILLLLTLPAAAHAALSGAGLNRAKSAFLFADKKDWQDARAYASESGSMPVIKLITLEYCLDADSGAPFDEITRFIQDNPEWPEQKKLRLRAEKSLRDSQVPNDVLIRWFNENPPVTGIGKLALAEALMHKGGASGSRIDLLLREAWRGGDFEEPQEKQFLKKYSRLLTQEDDIERASRLLWEEKVTPVKWMFSRLPHAYRRLAKARIALIQDKRFAGLAVAEVPHALRRDPGLTFDRLNYRERHGYESGARDLLLSAPSHVPYPDRWWKWREVEIIRAIDDRDWRLAERLLANHGQVDGTSLADAVWLSGWLKAEFLHRPKEGY